MGTESRKNWKIDPSKPSVARVYDYILGGKDNFAIDRTMGDKLRDGAPDLYWTARMNKDFGARVVNHAARQGIRQFLDLGSGIPTTPPSVHDTARAVAMDCSVVYVDNDPIVVAHSQALRDVGPGLATILADIESPSEIFAEPDLLSHIDLAKPVAVLIISVFQTVPDHARAHAIMAEIRDHLAPGSYLGLSHISITSEPSAIVHAHRSAEETGYPYPAFRDDEELMGFFEGFDLIDPGIVDIKDWRPDPDAGPLDETALILRGGVGVKR